MAAVSFAAGGTPTYDEIPGLFVPEGRLFRAGPVPESWTVEEFVAARHAAAGQLAWFEERELSETTELFGDVAHRFSAYSKRAEGLDVRGAISTQFVRTPEGWRISSMAWDDERS